jgi:hypothetical protein
MVRRRRCLLFLLAAVAVLGVLALPAVHWRLVGWARGEPFYAARPVSYWRGVVREAELDATFRDSGPLVITRLTFARAEGRVTKFLRRWLPRLGPTPRGERDPPLPAGDPAALPVLESLLADGEPKVRAAAAHALGNVGAGAARTAPALRRLAHDPEGVVPGLGFSVGQVARAALHSIEADALGQEGSPGGPNP